MNKISISNLRCEYLVNPTGIDNTSPCLSWELESKERNSKQTAYQILAASSIHLLEKEQADLWDTGKVLSEKTAHIHYTGSKLNSAGQVFWKLRIWNQNDQVSAWSSPATWTMGLLTQEEWGGEWIGLEGRVKDTYLRDSYWIVYAADHITQVTQPVQRYYRCSVFIPSGREVKRIYFLYTGDNGCTGWINGRELGPRYDHNRIKEFDLTYRFTTGENIIALTGFAPGKTVNSGGVVGLLEIQYKDGTGLAIPTDERWKVSDKEIKGWNESGFDDSAWESAVNLGPVGPAPWGEVRIGENRRLPARYLRKEFFIKKKVKRSLVFYSGLGWSELYINRKKTGDEVLSPGLSQYPKRIYYITHDVTHLLHEGTNAIGAILGNGRYYSARSKVYASMPTYGFPKLRMHLRIEYDDGTVEKIVSDESWKMTADGPIIANNHFDGEEYDARKELGDWTLPAYDDSGWQNAQKAVIPDGVMHAQMINPVRVTDTLKPITITEPKPGVFIFDLGQNITGWCRLKVSGRAGAAVTLRHAEVLLPDGTLSLANLRSAQATDIYILNGNGIETWEPRFTTHGFRYVEVTGFSGIPDINAIEGRMMNDDMQVTGSFNCSNQLLNQIYKNITWGVRGNYKTIPMDCPQRDERQGWLGDRSEVMRGEFYLFDITSFYTKWLCDIRDAQHEDGVIDDVAPTYWPEHDENVAWPSAALIIINALYEQNADKEAVRMNYESVKRWMDHMCDYLDNGIIDLDKWGDWCVPPEEMSLIHTKDPDRITGKAVIATCFFYHDAKLMERFAHLLEYPEDEKRFADLAETLKTAFNKRFYNQEQAQYDNGTQTSYILPLAFNMVPGDQRTRVFNNLVKNIVEKTNSHIGCGLIGMKYLFRVLSENGRPDLAYTIATQRDYPGYGYMISKGATTIWELWNGDTADTSMNSGNHVMLIGDLVIWLYEHLAGIKTDTISDKTTIGTQPGFKHIIMKPHIVPGLHYVDASYHSIRGKISSNWKNSAHRLEWNITIPPNCTAEVHIPTEHPGQIYENNIPITQVEEIQFIREDNGFMVFHTGSGMYQFTAVKRMIDKQKKA